MKKVYLKKNKGQTLIETLVALSMIVLILGAAYGLLAQGIKVSRASLQKIQAYNLAQEGIEYVRYLRDSNYVNNEQYWCNFDISPLSNSISLGGKNFSRNITINPQIAQDQEITQGGCAESYTITSTVTWENPFGQEQSFELKEILYDFKP